MEEASTNRPSTFKNFFSTHNNKVRNIVCFVLAFFLAFFCATRIVSIPTSDEITACQEELASYLASPSRYAINTEKYTLEISNKGTRLSCNDYYLSCMAIFDETTDSYNYTSSQPLVMLYICLVFLFILFLILFFFVFNAIFLIIVTISRWFSEKYSSFSHERSISKASKELNITPEDANEYDLSIQQMKAYDRGYDSGRKKGYAEGRKQGFEHGQRDSYLEGYEKGYADAMDAISVDVTTYMNSEE